MAMFQEQSNSGEGTNAGEKAEDVADAAPLSVGDPIALAAAASVLYSWFKFYGQDDEYPHDVRFGEDYTTGVFFQWQADSDGNGVQEVIWPDSLTTSEYVPAPWNQ